MNHMTNSIGPLQYIICGYNNKIEQSKIISTPSSQQSRRISM